MHSILTVVGARPQFVKAAVVSRALEAERSIREVVVHTGQHYDANMSAVFFQELEIPPPDYHLGIGSGPHGAQTGKMLAAIEQVLAEVQPDLVLVYGDTNSTLAGALAAAKMHIPVAHVEAGLRSFNRRMPEEINRIVTDQVSDLLLAPTQQGADQLLSEGIPPQRIRLVGDVMYDAALYYGQRAPKAGGVAEQLGLKPRSYVLATIHRAENVDEPRRLRAVFRGLDRLAHELPVVLPLHPRTRRAAERQNLLAALSPALHCIEPVGYLDMLSLERESQLIVTDSGGVQKEAFFVRVPCLTVREETEWTELVELGWNRLVPRSETGRLAEVALQWLDKAPRRHPPDDLYGGGQAGQRICQQLVLFGRQRLRRAA